MSRDVETDYDALLAMGWDRRDARARVEEAAARVLSRWADAV